MTFVQDETGRATVGGSFDDRQADFAFAISVVVAVVLVGLLYALFTHIVAILLISALLAYALLPLVNRLEGSMPRWVAVMLVGLGVLGLLVLVGFLAVPAAIRELQDIGDVVEQSRRVVITAWSAVLSWLPGPVAAWLDQLGRTIASGVAGGAPSMGTIAEWARSAGSGIASVATGILFVPIFVVVMLRHFPRIGRGASNAVPPRWRARFEQRAKELDKVLSGFIRGQLLVAFIIAVLYVIGFTIVGIPLAVIVGMLAGLGELVPYLGGAIALALGILMALAGGQPLDALWVALIFLVVQGLEGGVISPWVVGRQAKLGAGTVIVALAVGGQLFGVVGLLIAVPVAAMLKVAARAAGDGYQQTEFYRRRTLVPVAQRDDGDVST
ncbi:MAG TPA: AI-2E family transporter [Gemmatimonadaceae bacterium]